VCYYIIHLTFLSQIFDFFLSEDDVAEMRFLDKGENGRSFDYTKIFPGLAFLFSLYPSYLKLK
jgi:hypothetical protein